MSLFSFFVRALRADLKWVRYTYFPALIRIQQFESKSKEVGRALMKKTPNAIPDEALSVKTPDK